MATDSYPGPVDRELLKGLGLTAWGVVLIVSGILAAVMWTWGYLWVAALGVCITTAGVVAVRRQAGPDTAEPPQPRWTPAGDIELPDRRGEGTLSVDEAVEVLAGADRYATPGERFGVAAAPAPTSAAYFTLRAAGVEVRPRIEYLLANAAPGGRLYAGMLLQRLDPAAARTVWEGLAGDPTELGVMRGGCDILPGTVADFATSMLTGRPLL